MADKRHRVNIDINGPGTPGYKVNGTKVVGAQETTFAALTDNSGGAAGDTIAAIGASYSQTEVRNAIASLAAKINTIRTKLRNHGLVA